MIKLIEWEKCKKEFIRKVEIDKDKIESIIKTADKRLKFIEQVKSNPENISFIVENYYEIIKELLTALLLKQGLRSQNHQCLISYFYNQYSEYESEAHIISQMCFLRNRLEYYGELIEFEFYNKNKGEFKNIINLLNKLLKNGK